MSDEAAVRIEDRERVRLLTLNRTKSLNAFNDAQYDALTHALQDAARDKRVSVAVITGAGRAFCAGQDLGEMGNAPEYNDEEPHGFQPFMDTIQEFPKPLIAAVNGIGVGIGLTMLPHCDFVLIASGARLRAPFVSLGVTVEAANSYLLPATVGFREAAEILYTGDWISAERCVEMGLATRMVEDDRLMEETLALADTIAAMPVTSLVATKRLLTAPRLEAINRARERENSAFERLIGAPANQEAIAAFMEKREPDFSHVSLDSGP